jgi:DNA (cytosine-5)-methyltransferase 1
MTAIPFTRLRLNNQGAIMLDSHPNDSRIGIAKDDLCQTIEARAGLGGGNTPILMEPIAYGICAEHANSMNSSNPHSGVYECDTAKTVTTVTQTPSNQGGLVVCVQGSVVGRKLENGPAGKGVNEDISFTLDSTDRHAVAYTETAPTLDTGLAHQNSNQIMLGGGAVVEEVYSMTTGSYAQVRKEQAPCLCSRDYKDAPIAFGIDRAAYNQGQNALYKPQIDEDSIHALTAQGPAAVSTAPSYIVRRLTPRECLVLMNLPPDWADNIAINEPTEDDFRFWEVVFSTLGKKKSRKQIAAFLRKPYSDGACYKMVGNGVITAVAEWVIVGIADWLLGLCAMPE